MQFTDSLDTNQKKIDRKSGIDISIYTGIVALCMTILSPLCIFILSKDFFVVGIILPFLGFTTSIVGLYLSLRSKFRAIGEKYRSFSYIFTGIVLLTSIVACISVIWLFSFGWDIDFGKFGDFIGK